MANTIKLEPLTFEEAIEYFRTKVALTPKQFSLLKEEVTVRAFTVAGIAKLDILKAILDDITRALESGITMETWRKDVNQMLESKGYQGLTPYRADTIFRTNIQTAYQVGRWKQLTDPDVIKNRPYLIYDAVNDSRTRPSHRALDGVTRRHDDPFWNTWYPPNGFRCRCSVRSASEREITRDGIKVETGPAPPIRQLPDGPAVPVIPDTGFGYNPAKAAWEPDLDKYPPKLKEAYLQRQQERGS